MASWNSTRGVGAAVVAVAACCALAGCSKSEIPVARVHGTVTVEGKPLAGGRIMLAPQPAGGNINPGKPAYGRLDAEGRYEVSTFAERDGAVVGTHLVTISAPREGNRAKKLGFRSLSVPSAFEVKADDENRLDISLTAEDVAKYAR
ncbi:MAG: hypothetical protein ACRCT8_06210 [Lacipirellulaceae bacterium]